jgi:hypothetical protein
MRARAHVLQNTRSFTALGTPPLATQKQATPPHKTQLPSRPLQR